MPDRLTPTPPSTETPNLEPLDAIISEVAALGGTPDDAAMREEALSAIVRAAARMNGMGLWLAARTVQSWTLATSSPGDDEFLDGATSLTLPDDWAWPALGARILDSDGNVVGRPSWASWAVYRSYASDNSSEASGVPQVLSIRSPEDGTVYLWPPVDGDTVSTIELPYYRRVATLTSQDTLFLTPESREALIAGGEYFIVKRRERQQPAVIATYWRDFVSAVRSARSAEARARRLDASPVIPLEVSLSRDWSTGRTTTYTVRV